MKSTTIVIGFAALKGAMILGLAFFVACKHDKQQEPPPEAHSFEDVEAKSIELEKTAIADPRRRVYHQLMVEYYEIEEIANGNFNRNSTRHHILIQRLAAIALAEMKKLEQELDIKIPPKAEVESLNHSDL
jgi:hypothetical protein